MNSGEQRWRVSLPSLRKPTNISVSVGVLVQNLRQSTKQVFTLKFNLIHIKPQLSKIITSFSKSLYLREYFLQNKIKKTAPNGINYQIWTTVL